MSAAALVDALVHAKRSLIRLPDPPMEYNSMMICADELSAFMHKFDDEMIGNLTTFYDVDVYGHKRRGKEIDIKIKHPQLSILSGTTPSNLLNFMPENAWDQGFTSRVIMVFSDERIISDDIFAFQQRGLPDPMLHDLRQINTLAGPFGVTDEYKSAINNWRKLGQPPVPTHPKLAHYCTRRLAHLFKLSMVSAVDRSNALILSRDDFNRAMTWMVEAESTMPEIFKAGSTGADSKAMDELFHFCLARAEPVSEPLLVREARKLVPAMSVMRVIEVMMLSGMIKVAGTNKGIRHFKAVPMNSDA
jgi:hypothetical protein